MKWDGKLYVALRDIGGWPDERPPDWPEGSVAFFSTPPKDNGDWSELNIESRNGHTLFWIGEDSEEADDEPRCPHSNKDFKSINMGDDYRDKYYRCRDCGARIELSSVTCADCNGTGDESMGSGERFKCRV